MGSEMCIRDRQTDSAAGGMDTAGYYTISPLRNLGSVFVFMVLLFLLQIVLLLAKCTYRPKRLEEDASLAEKTWSYLLQNINLRTHIKVLVG